jgi:4-hydroxy-2-oxoheptanedioate aldolase
MLPDPYPGSRLRCRPVTTDPVRARWAAGEAAYAAWLTLESPAAAEIAAAAGFDAVVVDLQHGHATLDDLPAIIAAIERTPTLPFIRASWNGAAELMRALDLGARGIICPMVGSRAEAEAFVGACRYPPVGTRSYGPIHAAFGQGREQTGAADAALLLFAMIETADGLATIDEIAATPGLDGLFVGPADLSLAMGLDTFADLTDPALLETLDTIVETASRHGITPGIHAPSPPRAAEMAARGFRFISCAVDADLLREAAVTALRATRDPRSAG